jgi:putative hydrolase of the HAD superfamily
MVDLGNVLINFNHWIAANKFAKFSSRNLDDIYNLLFDSPFTSSFEVGAIKPEAFFLAMKEELGMSIDYNRFLPIWNEIFFLTSDNVQVYQLVRTLKERFKVIMISNINQLHFEYLKENFRIFDPFDKIILSYEVGVRKPHPKIYTVALDQCAVSNHEAFYIDDRLDLVEAASRLGIRGVQFKSFELLKRNLEDERVLQAKEEAPKK